MDADNLINALEDYKLQQSNKKSLPKRDIWLICKTIDECIKIIKKKSINESKGD